jgi:hypothetical protein
MLVLDTNIISEAFKPEPDTALKIGGCYSQRPVSAAAPFGYDLLPEETVPALPV